VGAAWDNRVRAMIERLKSLQPMPGPFELEPGSTVIDPVKFHASLLGDAALETKGARWKTGAFTQHLERYLALRGEK